MMQRTKKNRKSPEKRLSQCAEILCEAAYRMCSESLSEEKGAVEPKYLKDACSAVKEAASVYAAASENLSSSSDALVIRFEQAAENCSQ